MKGGNKKVIVKGIGASPGIFKGIVRIAFDPMEALRRLQKDDVLVTSMTDPSWTICLGKVKAIVTNTGGILSHAAIVAREMGIPCVVGTRDATEKLRDNMKVIVDGFRGVVYEYEES